MSSFLDGLNSIVNQYLPPTNTGNNFLSGLNHIVQNVLPNTPTPFYPTPTGRQYQKLQLFSICST